MIKLVAYNPVWLIKAELVAVMKFGRYKLDETLSGVVNTVLVPVINPGVYKSDASSFPDQ